MEGFGQDVWEPEIEAARQTYKLLAEQASDPKQRQKHQEDLEAAVRLARMDLGELQGLPLPPRGPSPTAERQRAPEGVAVARTAP